VSVALRPIEAGDEAFLQRVYASTRQEELAPVPWTDAQKSEFLWMQFRAQHAHYQQHYPGARFSVILENGAPVGRLYVHPRADELRLVDIALLPEARGRGTGRTLILEVLEEARARAVCVRIHVEQSNRALGLYTRLGFRPVGENGIYLLLEWRPGLS